MDLSYLKSNRLKIVTNGFLIFVGIFLVIGPEWIKGPIHIHLFRDHGIETQDIVAIIPFSIGSLWFAKKIWDDKSEILNSIIEYPAHISFGIFVIGLGVGVVLGLLLAYIF